MPFTLYQNRPSSNVEANHKGFYSAALKAKYSLLQFWPTPSQAGDFRQRTSRSAEVELR